MADLLKHRATQAVAIAVASALLGGLLMGYISLPKSVTTLEVKALALEDTDNKHDGRITSIERDYVGKREMEGHMSSLGSRIDKLETKFDKLKDIIIERLPDK